MRNSRTYFVGAILALAQAIGAAGAQESVPNFESPPSRKEGILPPELGFVSGGGYTEPFANQRTPRIRLFRMPAGFLADPIGINPDNDPTPTTAEQVFSFLKDADDAPLNRIQAGLGNDNPLLDFRRPGDPGGIGYYRLFSQFQLLDTQATGITVGCEAFSPAGLENDGVSDGPTFFSPNFALFQDLGDGTALHGFVGTHMRAAGKLPDSLSRGFQYGSVHYGMALQQPLVTQRADPSCGLYFFVEALGRYRTENDFNYRQQSDPWEILPGLHWRLSDSWWLSGAVVLPKGTPRPENRFWQLTCSFQF